MPIYEYQCHACGTALEVVQRITESPLKTCTSCGKDALEKLISASAFHLKGGGWYSDLYSSTSKDKAKPDAPAAKGDAPAAAAPASTSTAPAAAPASSPASSTVKSGGSGSSGGSSSTASA
jgi:putative FmdB family regulatory protein